MENHFQQGIPRTLVSQRQDKMIHVSRELLTEDNGLPLGEQPLGRDIVSLRLSLVNMGT